MCRRTKKKTERKQNPYAGGLFLHHVLPWVSGVSAYWRSIGTQPGGDPAIHVAPYFRLLILLLLTLRFARLKFIYSGSGFSGMFVNHKQGSNISESPLFGEWFDAKC